MGNQHYNHRSPAVEQGKARRPEDAPQTQGDMGDSLTTDPFEPRCSSPPNFPTGAGMIRYSVIPMENGNDHHRRMPLPRGALHRLGRRDSYQSLLVPRLSILCRRECNRKSCISGRRSIDDWPAARLFEHRGQRQPDAPAVLRALWNARN